MRGFAYTSLAAGQDISERITQLYAPPGAWSHGQLWGADTIEVPASATFAPKVEPITALNPQVGGVRGGGKADWYALAIRGTAEARAVLDLLRDGIDGEIADAAFTSASAGSMPAGSVLFQNTAANVAALTAAGLEAGVWFERVLAGGQAADDTGRRSAADRGPRQQRVTDHQRHDAQPPAHLRVGRAVHLDIAGTGSLQNAAVDPLDGIDVIYNTGQNYPASVNISAAPAGATQSGSIGDTIQTTAAHDLAVGSTVTGSGVDVAGYNGTFTVTAVRRPTGSRTKPGQSGLAASGGGTVTYTGLRPCTASRVLRGWRWLHRDRRVGHELHVPHERRTDLRHLHARQRQAPAAGSPAGTTPVGRRARSPGPTRPPTSGISPPTSPISRRSRPAPSSTAAIHRAPAPARPDPPSCSSPVCGGRATRASQRGRGRRTGHRPRQHDGRQPVPRLSRPTRSRGATSSGPGRSSRRPRCGRT